MKRYRKIISLFLVIAMLLPFLPVKARAEVVKSGTCGENLTWALTEDGTLTISGEGQMYHYDTDNRAPWYEQMASITSVFIKDGVTSIGNYAFHYCRNLTSIDIPDGVTSIGDYAFYFCHSLTSIHIPKSVTSIGTWALYYCSSLTSIHIPDGVTSISDYVFDNCSRLTSIHIPESVTSIGDGAFYYCSSLTSIDIPDSVTSIGYSAFRNCSSLTSIHIPESVTSIGYSAFEGCSSLTNIDIPESVTSIGEYAFFDCSSLTSIHIPESVTSIGSSTFSGCSNLTSIQIPDSVTSLGRSAFSRCSNLTSIDIPDSVTSIGEYAFYGCSSLTSIHIPDGVPSIGSSTFSDCSSLTSIHIPDSVTSIGSHAFYGCSSLTSIDIPASVTSIGNNVFDGCGALTDVYYSGIAEQWNTLAANTGTDNDPLFAATIHIEGTDEEESPLSGTCGDNLTWTLESGTLTISGTGDMTDFAYGEAPWFDLHNDIKTVVIGEGVTGVGSYAFYTSSGLFTFSQASFPGSLTRLGEYAFGNCNNLTSVTLPGGVQIGNWAFSNCDGLEKLTIGSGSTVIGEDAFVACTGLKEVTVGSGLTTIGSEAFGMCTSLAALTIPNTITAIGEKAFVSCTSLSDVYYSGTQAQWEALKKNVGTSNDPLFAAVLHCNSEEIPEPLPDLPGIGGSCGENLTWSFDETTGTLTISGTGAMSITGDIPWLDYRDSIVSIVVESGATTISQGAFGHSSALTSVTLPGTLTSIGSAAFYQCKKLTSITLPNTIKVICEYTFFGCSSLATVNLPNSLRTVEASAFQNCASLKQIVLPDTVTTVGEYAFCGCTSLTSLTLSDKLSSIGKEAFSNCPGLQKIDLPDTLTSIGVSAFSGCSSLTSMYIPSGVTRIPDSAFRNCSNLHNVHCAGNVTTIDSYAFSGCSSLHVISLMKGLKTVNISAFADCDNLEKVYFGGTRSDWETVLNTMGTGNDALTDAELFCYDDYYEAATKPSNEEALLQHYANNWLAAYNNYIAAASEVLSTATISRDVTREEMIEQEAARMRNEDSDGDGNNYLITLTGYSAPDLIVNAVYKSVAAMIYDHAIATNIQFSSPNFDALCSSLVTDVWSQIRQHSGTYNFDGYRIEISMDVYFGLYSGKVFCYQGNSDLLLYSAWVCSTKDEIEDTLRAFNSAAKELGHETVNGVYTAVAQDLLSMALADLTTTYLDKRLKELNTEFMTDVEEALVEAGVGALLDALSKSYEYNDTMTAPILSGDLENMSLGTNLAHVIGMDFRDDLATGKVKKALKNLNKAAETLTDAFDKYLDGDLSVSDAELFLKTRFNCPVSVAVFNSEGTQIGYVGEDDIWYDDTILIEERYGAKEISFYTDDIPSFVITATDYGTMSCSFEEYGTHGAPLGRLNYYDISLTPGQIYTAALTNDLQTNAGSLPIMSGEKSIPADEYISVTDNAAVSISCTVKTNGGSAGGSVYGGGAYARGDAVVLTAAAADGYHFAGWYRGDTLYTARESCEFTAREDLEMTALFCKMPPISVRVYATAGGTVTGNRSYNEGEQAVVNAFADDGYVFVGWYADDELVSSDTQYGFYPEGDVVLKAVFANSNPSVIRLSGKDRYLTAFAVANRLKELIGVPRFDTVIVAYGQKFPDALTGSYLAAVKNAPILLTEPNKDALVLDYISENLTSGGKVYILGGSAAVSENFENSAKEAGFDVVRLKGKGRYETNLEILKEAGVNETDEILIATGTNFADSLSASATKLPMLLVGPGLTAEQKDFLATTSRKFVIIGGTGAVNEAVEAELAQIGTVERIKGKTRYETSVVIAERYFTDPAAAVLAYAQGFPDGLCGGPLAMNMGAPLILTSNESPTAADDYIEGITVGAVTGGTGRITDDTVRAIFDLAAETEIPIP